MATPAEKRRMRDALKRRFTATWARIGATGPAEKAFDALADRYEEKHRAYHTLDHLTHCLKMLDATRHLAQDADMVELALWYHDAIYDVGSLATGPGKENEAKSALLMVSILTAAGVAPARVERASRHTLATAKHGPSADPDTSLTVDIDLAILGVSPEAYERFEKQIKVEYSWVPAEMFGPRRAQILAGFLPDPNKPEQQTYATEFFRTRYGETAKYNLERAIARLSGGAATAATAT